MRLKPPNFVIDPNNIFANDTLNRKSEIESLSNIVTKVEPPFVLAINGGWGTGKTTFLRLWKAFLAQENDEKTRTVNFNAWETDFAEDPLIAFVGELTDQILENLNKDPNKIKQLQRATTLIAKKALPIIVRLATAGILDIEAQLEKEISAFAEEVSKDAFSEYLALKNQIAEFKKLLKELLGESDRLIVFVDELDRCRPVYAIELLERIKHILDLDQLVFVLAMDRDQLAQSVKAVYGTENSNGYLRRFIDLEYNLRRAEKDQFIAFLLDDIEVFSKDTLSNNVQKKLETELVLNSFSDFYGASLRAVEKIAIKFRLYMLTLPVKQRVFAPFVMYLFVLFELDHPAYTEYVIEKNVQAALDTYRQTISYPNFADSSEHKKIFTYIEANLVLALDQTQDLVSGNAPLQTYTKRYNEDLLLYKDNARMAEYLRRVLGHWKPGADMSYGFLDQLRDRMEFMKGIDFRNQ